MTGRFLLAVLLTLSMVGQIFAQVSASTSVSRSVAASLAVSTSNSGSYSNSISAPVPAAPINLTNHFPGCALRPDNTNHIYYLCLAWSDPTGGSVQWIVTYTPAGGVAQSVTTFFPALYLPNLTAATTYTISIVGVNAAGRSSAALTGTYTTDPTDAKTAHLTKDLQNLVCANGISNTTFRKVINCNWGAPTPALPSRIDIKARCISTIWKNKVLRRNLKGAATSVQLPVHRAQYTCYIEIFGVYLNHKANDGHGHKFVQTCSSTTGCVKVQ